MRLSYVVLVAAVSIFACCEGTSAISESKSLAVPQSHVHTENNGNRFLRFHQEEERAGAEVVAKVASKLQRSISDLGKLDDVATLNAIRAKNTVNFKHIENVMGLDPDGMLLKMKELDIIDLTLLKHYTKYWNKRHPDWISTFSNKLD